VCAALIEHRELWWRLTQREIDSRYKGSILGFGWSLVQPLVMMGIYTFVFATIFKSRWVGLEDYGSMGYAVNLFAGLIVFNLFADCTTTAPGLIIRNKNYVTKIIFPLELLGATTLASAAFQAVMSTVILIVFQMATLNSIPITILLLPLVWLPLLIGCLSLTWLLSAFGVFVRDVEQLIPMLVSVMMFLSAIFYPVSSLPKEVQVLMQFNPLAQVVEQTRNVAISGQQPSVLYIVVSTLISIIGCELAYRCFQKARRGFADVL